MASLFEFGFTLPANSTHSNCAICHGNDGRGATTIGKNLYPKAPDMTLPGTQKLTDVPVEERNAALGIARAKVVEAAPLPEVPPLPPPPRMDPRIAPKPVLAKSGEKAIAAIANDITAQQQVFTEVIIQMRRRTESMTATQLPLEGEA